MIFLNILLLAVGMVLLIKGADWFVDGASRIAKAMKIPSLVIGLTLVSIGTSAPEFSVSLVSSIQKMNDMSFGNIIGSNIFNTFVVIGASTLFVPLTVSKDMKKYDLPILMGIYVVLGVFAFAITPEVITLVESIIIFALFFAYTAHLIIRSRNEKVEEDPKEKKRAWYINVLIALLGLGCIVFGGDIVVDNASEIAKACGMSELLVGLTIVAVGTSLPELATSIIAARKGEHDIAVGNAIGSCIFNVVLILGACSTISPMTVDMSSLFDVIVMLISAIMVYLLSFKKMKVTKLHGIILMLCYVAYLAYIVIRNVAAA